MLTATASLAATVTVDIVQKTAVSDSDTVTARVLKTADNQVNVLVNSNIPEPTEFALKIIGLSPGKQDVYVNGKLTGQMPDSELASGARFSIPGRIVNPVLFRCVESVRDRLDQEVRYVQTVKEDEHVRVLNTLRQAVDWVRSATQSDKAARSVSVIVAPEGAMVRTTATTIMRTPEESAQVYANVCKTLQQARDRMYDHIKFGVLRNQAVLAMTPVDLKLSYYTVNGKPKGTAVLINNCDLPISGKITPIAPAGWKINSTNLVFSNLASGQSHKADFALVPLKDGDAAPKMVKAEAAARLVMDTYAAKFTLTAESEQGATVTVPLVRKVEAKPAPMIIPGASRAVTAPAVVEPTVPDNADAPGEVVVD